MVHTNRSLTSSTTLITILLFLLALAPRLLAPGDFWTADEAKHWSVRVDTFWPAIEQGNYVNTNLVGHPGVTTMWLGTLGVWLQQWLGDLGLVHAHDPALYRTFLRVPVAIVTALCAALAYPLLRRLTTNRIALLATLLWIGDPFIVAHSKLLHVDALLMSFIMLSLLTAFVALEGTDFPLNPWRNGFLIASGIAGGLALLTKSPSMILVPMIGLIAVVAVMRCHIAWSKRIRMLCTIVAVWGTTAAIVWVGLWPAAWVAPFDAVATVVNEVSRNGAVPHGWGNFFMGRVVQDPGPLFYPVAIVLRLTPWTLIGMLLAGIAVLWHLFAHRSKPKPSLANAHFSLPLLLLFALLFIVMMAIPPKKFDRYVLPVFPVLNLVAAIGIVWSFDRLTSMMTQARAAILQATLLVVAVVGMGINLAWFHPYELSYFNPLVGGGDVAQRSIYVGWGEGLEKAAYYISEQYNGCELGIASWYEDVILPYSCVPVLQQGYITRPGHINYAVLYINQIQRKIKSEVMPHIHERGARVHTVTIHDIDYAYVYQMRQPRQYEFVDAQETIVFGSSIQLTGYDVITTSIQSHHVLTLTLQWHTLEPMDKNYMLFVHAFDAQGNQIGQTDVPPGGPAQPTSAWGNHRFIDWMHRIPVQPGATTDTLWIGLGLYDPDNVARLPLQAPTPPPDAPDDGENVWFFKIQVPD